jgi:hypothetical protein
VAHPKKFNNLTNPQGWVPHPSTVLKDLMELDKRKIQGWGTQIERFGQMFEKL